MRVRKTDPSHLGGSSPARTSPTALGPPTPGRTSIRDENREDEDGQHEPGLPLPAVHERHSDEFIDTVIFESPIESVSKKVEECSGAATKKDINDDNNSGFLDFSNSKWMVFLAYTTWCIVLVANAYAIVMLILQR
jgi:hypothetical protein